MLVLASSRCVDLESRRKVRINDGSALPMAVGNILPENHGATVANWDVFALF